MKKRINFVAVIAAVVFGLAVSLPAVAQTGNIPDSKIAIVYSDAFLAEKTGIAKFNRLASALNREFEPRQMELKTLQQKIKALEDEINKIKAVADPKVLQSKLDQRDQMTGDLRRKGEDAQVAYDKRRKDVFTPLQSEIGDALEAYAKARNINLIVDGSQVPMIYAASAIDITRDFINDYNHKNP